VLIAPSRRAESTNWSPGAAIAAACMHRGQLGAADTSG
jgi:hypothetical protein